MTCLFHIVIHAERHNVHFAEMLTKVSYFSKHCVIYDSILGYVPHLIWFVIFFLKCASVISRSVLMMFRRILCMSCLPFATLSFVDWYQYYQLVRFQLLYTFHFYCSGRLVRKSLGYLSPLSIRAIVALRFPLTIFYTFVYMSFYYCCSCFEKILPRCFVVVLYVFCR